MQSGTTGRQRLALQFTSCHWNSLVTTVHGLLSLNTGYCSQHPLLELLEQSLFISSHFRMSEIKIRVIQVLYSKSTGQFQDLVAFSSGSLESLWENLVLCGCITEIPEVPISLPQSAKDYSQLLDTDKILCLIGPSIPYPAVKNLLHVKSLSL